MKLTLALHHDRCKLELRLIVLLLDLAIILSPVSLIHGEELLQIIFAQLQTVCIPPPHLSQQAIRLLSCLHIATNLSLQLIKLQLDRIEITIDARSELIELCTLRCCSCSLVIEQDLLAFFNER